MGARTTGPPLVRVAIVDSIRSSFVSRGICEDWLALCHLNHPVMQLAPSVGLRAHDVDFAYVQLMRATLEVMDVPSSDSAA